MALSDYYIAADIGGTHARFGLYVLAANEQQQQSLVQKQYSSKAYTNCETLIAEFIRDCRLEAHQLQGASLAFAGPVLSDSIDVTNLPWVVNSTELQKTFGFEFVYLHNDFQAMGYGVPLLESEHYEVIHQATNTHDAATQLLIGAGTGLGVAMVQRCGATLNVLPSQAGHLAFAPMNDLQKALLEFYQQRQSYVSCEALLSGIGLCNLFVFLHDLYPQEAHDDLRQLLKDENLQASDIGCYAQTHLDPLCLRVLDLFMDIYAQTIGNVALMCLPYGGIYVTGGIAPQLLSRFRCEQFKSVYFNKGAMTDLLREMPLQVVTNTQLGLLGAAHYPRSCL